MALSALDVQSITRCRACGATALLIRVVGKPGARRARSRCFACSATTTRALTDAETYVLWTMPRGDVFVHFAAGTL